MKITIVIQEDESKIKQAIADGWNRLGGDVKPEDIKDINRDDIIGAVSYLDSSCIAIIIDKRK